MPQLWGTGAMARKGKSKGKKAAGPAPGKVPLAMREPLAFAGTAGECGDGGGGHRSGACRSVWPHTARAAASRCSPRSACVQARLQLRACPRQGLDLDIRFLILKQCTLKSVCTMACVSRAWRDCVYRCALLYPSELELSTEMDARHMSSLLLRAERRVRKITIPTFNQKITLRVQWDLVWRSVARQSKLEALTLSADMTHTAMAVVAASGTRSAQQAQLNCLRSLCAMGPPASTEEVRLGLTGLHFGDVRTVRALERSPAGQRGKLKLDLAACDRCTRVRRRTVCRTCNALVPCTEESQCRAAWHDDVRWDEASRCTECMRWQCAQAGCRDKVEHLGCEVCFGGETCSPCLARRAQEHTVLPAQASTSTSTAGAFEAHMLCSYCDIDAEYASACSSCFFEAFEESTTCSKCRRRICWSCFDDDSGPGIKMHHCMGCGSSICSDVAGCQHEWHFCDYTGGVYCEDCVRDDVCKCRSRDLMLKLYGFDCDCPRCMPSLYDYL